MKHACMYMDPTGRYLVPIKISVRNKSGFDSTNGTVPGDCYLYCISPARTRTILYFLGRNVP